MASRDRFLSGHTLRAAVSFTISGCPECDVPVAPAHGYKSVPGHGLCSCREISPHLSSGMARRKWHNDHKATKRAELARAYLGDDDVETKD